MHILEPCIVEVAALYIHMYNIYLRLYIHMYVYMYLPIALSYQLVQNHFPLPRHATLLLGRRYFPFWTKSIAKTIYLSNVGCQPLFNWWWNEPSFMFPSTLTELGVYMRNCKLLTTYTRWNGPNADAKLWTTTQTGKQLSETTTSTYEGDYNLSSVLA